MRRFIILCFALMALHARSETPPNKSSIWEDISGENALNHVQALVEFGPRPPATEAIEKSRDYITKQLEGFGWRVARQSFTDDTPQGKVTFVNLIATFHFSEETIPPSWILCSHYDTKIFTTARFVGANDGGSSTGLLIEMARVFAQRPELARKLELVFFDGEEAFVQFTDKDGLYGSRYFAKQLAADGKAKQFRGGLLFDMIGDSSLNVTFSTDSPRELVNGIFSAADALGLRKHFTYFQSTILDDHAPLNAIGIPTLDLIDFDYPPWHTPEDTIDKLSAESLKVVGSVATRYLVETALK
ncbi:MAG TPA: M28 family peptidase [Chthoniobacterales bacterium]